MKPTPPRSRRPFDATESSPDFLGPILPEGWTHVGRKVQAFPRFPTVQQMLDHQGGGAQHPLLQLSEIPPPSKPASLFKGLLGGNVDVLAQDAIDHPERYDAQAQLVLAELSAGTRKLTDADQPVLDRATLDYASGTRAPAPPKAKPQPPVRKPRLVEEANEYELKDGRAPQVEEPGGTMTPYWWLG